MGRWPVLLLSRDEAYQVREYIIVSPLTNRRRNLPTEVRLGPDDGLPQESVANLDVIITMPKRQIRELVTGLSPQKIRDVEAAVHFALGMQD
jgi:mRNA interferase MazF